MKYTKIIAAIALAAVGSTTWSSAALAGSCYSSLKPWYSQYYLQCYNQFGYVNAAAYGEGTNTGAPYYYKVLWNYLAIGSQSYAQGHNSGGSAVAGCRIDDIADDGAWVYDTTGCDTATQYKVAAFW